MSEPADDEVRLDAARLPSYAFGHRSVMWWGVMGIIAIEGTAFALAIAAYLYGRAISLQWPGVAAPPDLTWGTVNTVVLLASLIPNEWTKRAAEHRDLRKVRIGLVWCLLFGLAFLAVRGLEFATLNVWWDTNAYGSAVWLLLGLHTAHLATDVLDSIVLTVLMFTGPLEGKRFVDVAENGFYWYFVVIAWIPLYALLYFAPRVL